MISQGKGIVLIMRHHHAGDVVFFQHVGHFLAHVLPQLLVQIGKRLIHQQQQRLRCERPGQRHPLLLTARQFVRILFRMS